jgi:glycosyltransferase involved in cell wall biosynthesis
MIKSKISQYPEYSIKYIEQQNQGQGIARNKGNREASGKIILFIGDDILIESNLLKEHVAIHDKYIQDNYACLGKIKWDPSQQITDEMKWSTNELLFLNKFGGHQFAFNLLRNQEFADYRFFYTSNISLKKNILDKENFDPDFKGYGWEDIELGYRLTKKYDLKIKYNQNAIALHSHTLNINDIKKRMEQIGYSSAIFQNKNPKLHVIPNLFKRTIFQLIGNKLSVLCLRKISKIFKKLKPVYYYAISKKHLLVGLNKFNNSK